MATKVSIPRLVEQKLAAFERIQPAYEACFRFIQEVHGQKRLHAFSLAQVVYYLHALWLCECKDRLLSINGKNLRYDGCYCLELLRTWQEGQSTEVVAFLTDRLNMLSFTTITSQLEEAYCQPRDQAIARRLEHGRLILLNRGLNFFAALDAMFSLSATEQLQQVRSACQQYDHTPTQIQAQCAELTTPLYAYRPHQLLAQQNMIVMNKLDVDVLIYAADMPGQRSEGVAVPTEPLAPFAEQVIEGYLVLRAPVYNNRRGVRFMDRHELERDAYL